MTKKHRARRTRPGLIPAPIREALAMHEALRRLGFSPDEIFSAYYKSQVAVVLKTQGKEFTITCGAPKGMSQEKFAELWIKACTLWNGTELGMSDATREAIYQESELMKRGHLGLALIEALLSKGIHPPVCGTLEMLAGCAPGSFAMGVNSKGGRA